jgi:hypothetical protein
MNHPLARLTALAVTAVTGLGVLSTGASADVPSFDRCPRADPAVTGCAVIRSTDGSIAASAHRLPLAGADVTVEGGITEDGRFVPPLTGPALTAKPVTVPGGLFGTDLPYRLNTVKATIEQVGPVSYDFFTYSLTAAVRIHFTNPLLGSNCAIGSAASPIALSLPVTTPGTLTAPPGTYFAVEGQVQRDTAFAVPAATGCGVVAQSTVTKAINQNLGLPSPAGANDATLTLDHYIAP